MEVKQRSKARVILHVDMNSFYASVEVAHNPALKGKPLAIAGNAKERRGIVVTCSYEARAFGVSATMPVWEALKKCPNLLIMEPNFDRYREASMNLFDLLRKYSDLVEPVSIDEGYVDITEHYGENGAVEYAKTIQKDILNRLQLPSSIGIAPNKFLAKTASNIKKPMGIFILRKRDVSQILWHLPASKMHGIGEKTAEKLMTIGIHTIGDLANSDEKRLTQLLGINGTRLKDQANGVDQRVVDPESIYDFKSIGNSTTLPRDITNQHELNVVLDKLSKKVASRLEYKELMATKLHVTIRYKDRKTYNRGCTLANPIDKTKEISEIARQLFHKNWDGSAVRLLGVTAGEVVDRSSAAKQLDLFSYTTDVKSAQLEEAISELKEKFGDGILIKGVKKNANLTNNSFSKDFLRKKKEQNLN
ncbi:MAG: polymerase [Bacillales bacterium]|jgi:DNA polymerase-4|nr:polymerase [Bacillales bacterium]